jgi:hypothetical protein
VSALFSGTTDIRLWIGSILVAVLLTRIAWLWPRGGLSQPEDWSSAERFWGRVSSWTFALAALLSGLTAAYAATRVPWVDNFSALLGMPAVVNGRPTWFQSTASYLFIFPLSLGVLAGAMTDPWTLQRISFRGPRDLVLRAAPVFALIAATYSIWHSVVALSAAVR